jgi:hypothetical protein
VEGDVLHNLSMFRRCQKPTHTKTLSPKACANSNPLRDSKPYASNKSILIFSL